jgi:multiple sugar transport system permease protein
MFARPSPAEWRSRIVRGFVIAPLVAWLALTVWRIGRDGRETRGERLVATADSAVAVLRSARSLDSASVTALLDDLRGHGLEPAWLPVAAGATSALPAGIAARLAALDRSFWIEEDGRITAVSPLEDVDGWDYIGVLVLRSENDPARFPFGPSAAALMTLAFVALTARTALRPSGRRSPAHHVWLDSIRPGSIFVAPLAFAVWSGTLMTPGAPGHAGQHGLWAAAGFAGWSILAGIGLSLVRIADRPLDADQAVRAWAFLSPSFLHLLVFSVGPILFALWLSFHKWNLLEPTRPFVGLDNYRELAGDADFWRAIRNTAVYVLFVPVGMAVALALALFVNRRIPGVHVMRTIFFLPYITSFVAISLVWRWMFQPDVGLFNNLLGRVGIPPQPWLSSPSSALPSLMLMSVWMYAGYMMVIFLAGLQNIPESLYESAKIDGAGPWRRFLHITLPMLRPTLLFILVTMIIFMFQVFTAVYVMTEGGPLHATDVIVYHVYRAAWEYLRMGYASAMAWVLFAIVFVITLIQFRFLDDRTGVAQ